MALRTWAKLLAATLGVAALAGASQLGVAYGLGILRLTRVIDITTRDQWTAQLAWVAWFAMMAAVLGGLAGGRLIDRWLAPPTLATHIALAVAAGLGAAVVVPLTMQPARTAQIAGVHPVFVIGMCAGLGAVVGVVAAYAALTQEVARWSLTVFGAAIWMLAIVSVAPSLAPSDPLPAVRLGVFDAGFLSPAVTQRTALFTMPALALVIGAVLGWRARRREMPTLTITLAGLPGPALLTLSYLIAGPGTGGDRYQVVPYWAAMTATGAGVLGSVLAAVIRRGDTDDDAQDADEKAAELATSPGGKPDDTGVVKLSDGGNRIPEPRPASDPGAPTGGSLGAPTGGGLGAPTGGGLGAPTGGDLGASAGGDLGAPKPVDGSMATHSAPGGGPPFGGPPLSRPPAGVPQDLPTVGRHPVESPPMGSPPMGSAPVGSGRRSSAADAFTARTDQWPARRPDAKPDPGPRSGSVALGDYAKQEPAPFDAFSSTTSPSFSDQSYAETPRPGFVDTTPTGAERTGFSQAPWSGASQSPRRGVDEGRTARGQHAAGTPQPYLPSPATSPLPPETIQEPAPTRTSGGFLGRGRLPFGRSKARASKDTPIRGNPARDTQARDNPARDTAAGETAAAQPAVPEPAHRPEVPPQNAPTWPGRNPLPHEAAQQSPPPGEMPPREMPLRGMPLGGMALGDVPSWDMPPRNSPLPDGPIRQPPPAGRGPLVPEPHAVSAPLPNPDPITPPLSVTPAPESDLRRGKGGKRQNDDEYVDWVSGLGSE